MGDHGHSHGQDEGQVEAERVRMDEGPPNPAEPARFEATVGADGLVAGDEQGDDGRGEGRRQHRPHPGPVSQKADEHDQHEDGGEDA